MVDPTPIATGDSTVARHFPHKVYLRQTWGAEWELEPWLYCDWLTFAAGPSIGGAQLQWRYGRGLREGADPAEYADVPPQDIVHWFVKIEITQDPDEEDGPILWHGRIVDVGDNRGGAWILESSREPTGMQIYQCDAIEAELDRVYLTRSIVSVPVAPEATPQEREIGRAIPFNFGTGQSQEVVVGNASSGVGDKATRIFADVLEPQPGGRKWQADEILEYLFAYFSPANKDGETEIPFVLSGQSDCLSWNKPRLDVHGRTLREVLNELVDRRRMVSYRVEVDPDDNTAYVEVFSLLEEQLDLVTDGGGSIPANDEQYTLDFDRAFDVVRATVSEAAGHRCDQVVCRGERRGCCFTISALDGNLKKDWTDAQATLYNAAASGAVDYSGLTRDEKRDRNEQYRKDDRLERVFSWFKISELWDGKVGNGINTAVETKPACPVLNADGEPTTAVAPFWRPGMRFESRLPLMEHVDYSGTALSSGPINALAQLPSGSVPEPLPTFAAIRLKAALPDRYQYLEKLNASADVLSSSSPGWAAAVRVQDHGAGIVVRVHGRQHLIAGGDWSAADADDAQERPGVRRLSWATDNLLATVFWLADEFVEQRWPKDSSLGELPAGAAVRQLVFHVPGARLDYVAPGTVVNIKDGELQRSTSGGFVRDDRQRLLAVAQTAFAWYGRERRILDLAFRQLRNLFHVGQFVAKIGADETEETINTAITSVHYDLLAGVTHIKTMFAELDVARFY